MRHSNIQKNKIPPNTLKRFNNKYKSSNLQLLKTITGIQPRQNAIHGPTKISFDLQDG